MVDSQIYVDLQAIGSILPILQHGKTGLALVSLICQILQRHPESESWTYRKKTASAANVIRCQEPLQSTQMNMHTHMYTCMIVCISLAILHSISIWTFTCIYQCL